MSKFRTNDDTLKQVLLRICCEIKSHFAYIGHESTFEAVEDADPANIVSTRKSLITQYSLSMSIPR